MFFLRNKDAKFPPLYDHIERKLPTTKDKGYDKIIGADGKTFVLREKIDFAPQPGLQEDFLRCDSNVIFLCGAASMGKTYAMIMKFLYGMDKPGFSGRFISMRLADSKKGTSTYRDTVELLGNFANCEVNSSDSPTFAWSKYNSAIQLIHSNYNIENIAEYNEFREMAKKNQASALYYDEASSMPYRMFLYWQSRNRDSSGMKPQMVLSFNAEYTHWTTTFLMSGGYINPDTFYIYPEMNGKTRYVYFNGDDVNDVIWGDNPEEVAEAAGVVLTEKDKAAGLTAADIVKSFTMFTGEASDNRKLIAATGGGSVANLHAVGKTQRAVLKGAYFGPTENQRAAVTKQMILNMPTNPVNGDENYYATLDVSAGGEKSDGCPMVIWKGLQIIAIEYFKGDMKELVEWINAKLNAYNVPLNNFVYDGTGVGYYLNSFINANPIISNSTSKKEVDEYGNPVSVDNFFNLRSQLLGKTQVLFQTGQISTSLDLNDRHPYGNKGEMRSLRDILFDEIDLFVSTTRNNKTYFLSKSEYKARHQKNSPDLMDSICLRAFFELDARPKKQPSPEISDDAYDELYQDYSGGRVGSVVWV